MGFVVDLKNTEYQQPNGEDTFKTVQQVFHIHFLREARDSLLK